MLTSPRLATSVGDLIPSAAAGGLDTACRPPDHAQVHPNGNEWRRWTTGEASAELLTGTVTSRLPAGMAVNGCEAAVWRLRAEAPVSGLTFTCRWQGLPAGAQCGPDAGEGLDAQSWQLGDTTVSLGTEDGESLAARASKCMHLPARLAPELGVATVRYLPDGLQVSFSSLLPGEVIQVQFAIAWVRSAGLTVSTHGSPWPSGPARSSGSSAP